MTQQGVGCPCELFQPELGFPDGGYRIQTTSPSPDPANLGNSRSGSLRSTSYSDFYISVDLVDWNDSLPQAIGILARINTPGLGTTTGYAFTWSRDTNPADAVLDITKITGEIPDDVSTSGSDHYYFVPGRKYRLVFIGQGIGLKAASMNCPTSFTRWPPSSASMAPTPAA